MRQLPKALSERVPLYCALKLATSRLFDLDLSTCIERIYFAARLQGFFHYRRFLKHHLTACPPPQHPNIILFQFPLLLLKHGLMSKLLLF